MPQILEQRISIDAYHHPHRRYDRHTDSAGCARGYGHRWRFSAPVSGAYFLLLEESAEITLQEDRTQV